MNWVFSRKSPAWQARQKGKQQAQNVLCVERTAIAVKVAKHHNLLIINELEW